MTARNAIFVVAFLLWAAISFLTIYVLVTTGPDVLVFISLIVMTTLGFGIFGALNERRK